MPFSPICRFVLLASAATLLASPALGQPMISESFNTGINGWTVYNDGRNLAWNAFSGNPGGAITASDASLGGYWGFRAPASFLGNRSCYYDGLLRWQFNTTFAGSGVNNEPDATIEGGGLVLVINLPDPVVNTWETRTVSLRENAGWRLSSLNGAVPTVTQFKAVLGNLTAIKLRGEFSTVVADQCILDNVALGSFVIEQPTDVSVCPTGSVTLTALATGAAPITHRWQYESAPNVWIEVPEGAVPYAFGTVTAGGVATDRLSLSFNTAAGAAPVRFRCVVTNSCGSITSDPALVAPCPADLNCDGLVDDTDFTLFVPAYDILDCADPAMPAACPSDFNGDGIVDDADFGIFVQAYNALGCF